MAVAEKPLYYLTIHEAQQLIRERKLSPVALTQAVLDRIVDGSNPQEPVNLYYPGDDLFTPLERRRGPQRQLALQLDDQASGRLLAAKPVHPPRRK